MKKFLIVIFAFTCLCFQCNTCLSPGSVRITVVDRNHQPVSHATITLKEHSNHIVGSGVSDINGFYIYNQENVEEQVLEVVVDSKNGLYHGAGIVSIGIGEPVEMTIMID